MKLDQLDTPSLLIDRERLLKNLADMQRYADSYGVQLRPHTKTHKMPAIAKLQLQQGACGVEPFRGVLGVRCGRAVEASAQKSVHPSGFIEGRDFDPAGSDVDGKNPRHAAPPYGRR